MLFLIDIDVECFYLFFILSCKILYFLSNNKFIRECLISKFIVIIINLVLIN